MGRGIWVFALLLAGCPTVPTTGDAGDADDGGPRDDAGELTDGGADAGSAADAGERTEARVFTDSLAVAGCAALARCADLRGGYDVAESCERVYANGVPVGATTFDTPDALARSMEAGVVTWTASGLARCLAALSAAPCEPGWPFPHEVEACRDALTGTLAEGAPCISRFACAPGLACLADSPTSCAGSCTTPSATGCATTAECGEGRYCAVGGSGLECRDRIDEGDACDFVPDECVEGLACVFDGETFACGALPGVGEPCSFQCVEGALCDAAGGGRCVARPVLDESCARLPCAAGFHCDPASDLCAVLPIPGLPGDPCLPGEQGSSCRDDHLCLPVSEESARCFEVGDVGDACVDSTQCGGVMSSFGCDASTRRCVRKPGPGAPCVEVVYGAFTLPSCDPFVAWCDPAAGGGQACVPLLPEGAPCTLTEQCGGYAAMGECDYLAEVPVCRRRAPEVCVVP